MPFTVAQKNAWLDGLTIDALSLHTADPGDTGANEVSGGSYARQSPTFDAASGGSRALSNTPVFDVPAGTTITHVGLWSGATFKGTADITDVTFSNDGIYTVSSGSMSIS